jgi:alanyl-tRNA synthetase
LEIHSSPVIARISDDVRRQTEKNHTATHLLHAALRRVLGTHVQQAGSLVTPERLRFDFTHHSKLEAEQLAEIERQINEKIQDDLALEITQESFETAREIGAMALFGEKYSDVVRTVKVPGFSFELCGGTHVKRTGQIGLFLIVYEGSIAAGVRRIEAATGRAAVKLIQNNRQQLNRLSEIVNAAGSELFEKVTALIESRRQLERELEKVSQRFLSQGLDEILASAETINGVNVISHKIDNAPMARLKEIGDQIREKAKNTVAVIGAINDDKINFVCVVSDDLIKTKGMKAGDLIQKVAGIAGGGGGGRPHMATAGGKDINKFAEAMAEIKKLV